MNVAAGDLAGFEEVHTDELAREPGSEWGPPEPGAQREETPPAHDIFDPNAAEERFEPDSGIADADAAPAESDTMKGPGAESTEQGEEDETGAREPHQG